jgi:hypothetical protein
MAAKITPHLIHLTYEAALKSFWRKKALRKFLEDCRITVSFLATWAEDETKGDFLDRLFEDLKRNDEGKTKIIQMAVFLADQTSFPDLKNWEDSKIKIEDAREAVSELKVYLKKQNEEIRAEREREEFKERARKRKNEIARSQLDHQKLKDRLEEMCKRIGTQKAGYDFQEWFFDMLDFSEITNRRPYWHEGRQIDGSLTHQGTTYLVELKFTSEQTGAGDIDSLLKKVNDKADNTMGIMVSISGYSSVSIKEASGPKTPILLMDYNHLFLFLTAGMKVGEIIERLRRHASQTGEAFLAATDFSG